MKLTTAYKIAIDALTLQQKKYYPGKVEYERSTYLFEWAVKANKQWEKLEAAKNRMIQEMHRQEQEEKQGSLFGSPTPPQLDPWALPLDQEGARTEAQNG